MALNRFLSISKALGDGTRARILAALENDELCLCQIVELLGLAPSTISKHMELLSTAGLVLRRKQGRWHYFRLAGRDASPGIRQALDWTLRSLQDDPQLSDDAKRLRKILEKDPREMAACYRS